MAKKLLEIQKSLRNRRARNFTQISRLPEVHLESEYQQQRKAAPKLDIVSPTPISKRKSILHSPPTTEDSLAKMAMRGPRQSDITPTKWSNAREASHGIKDVSVEIWAKEQESDYEGMFNFINK